MKDVYIYKEKKKEKYRMLITISGIDEVGLITQKDFAIISYLSKQNSEKIGELVFFALSNSDDELIMNDINSKWSMKWFNLSSSKKVMEKYNLIGFCETNNQFKLELFMKNGSAFSVRESQPEWTKHCFETKPTEKELGEMILELFERKEKEEGIE
ncbi:osmolarity sensor protein EnvZ [Streptobacillus canis]|uniref:osmolarity sensor protein EnvZ n=1 Tax=Streptobacillus canis TaxID=2678686 RepID=UPI0012E1CCA9|nr:osmolarity sensor protein EnvZ [Streptobacillus canis]